MGTDGALEDEVWHKLSVSMVLFILIPVMLAVLSALAQPAFAYVEPGSGLLAFQILGTILACVFFFIRKRHHSLLLLTHTIPNSEAHKKK